MPGTHVLRPASVYDGGAARYAVIANDDGCYWLADDGTLQAAPYDPVWGVEYEARCDVAWGLIDAVVEEEARAARDFLVEAAYARGEDIAEPGDPCAHACGARLVAVADNELGCPNPACFLHNPRTLGGLR